MYFVTDRLCVQVKLGGRKHLFLKTNLQIQGHQSCSFVRELRPRHISEFGLVFLRLLAWFCFGCWYLTTPGNPSVPRETSDGIIQSLVDEFGKSFNICGFPASFKNSPQSDIGPWTSMWESDIEFLSVNVNSTYCTSRSEMFWTQSGCTITVHVLSIRRKTVQHLFTGLQHDAKTDFLNILSHCTFSFKTKNRRKAVVYIEYGYRLLSMTRSFA